MNYLKNTATTASNRTSTIVMSGTIHVSCTNGQSVIDDEITSIPSP